MDEPIRQIGRYGIVREIGRGGMAVVYLARQVDLDRDVALKELNAFHAADPAFAERFVRESRVAGLDAATRTSSRCSSSSNEDGTPYIAMEYLERGSLRPYVGHMTLAQTIGVLEGALAGLAQAERREIVHRDIKPENLMVTADGEVKIADFGIAKALDRRRRARTSRPPARPSARPPTWRPSRPRRGTSGPGPTCTRSGSSPTR